MEGIMSVTCTNTFSIIEKSAQNFQKAISVGDLKAISKFTKVLKLWYLENKSEIEECSAQLDVPNITDSIEYQRNILARDINDKFVVFMHKMKIGGSTPFHNHGSNTNIFVLPITNGLIEDTYLHKISDFSETVAVNLYSIGIKNLNAGEVSFCTGNLLHKVSNSSDYIQSFIEIYFPIPKDIKTYIPYYNEADKYLQIKPIQTNLPHYKSLSTGESKLDCAELLEINSSLLFTSTEHILEDKESIKSYFEQYGCDYVEKVSDESYIIWSPEQNNAIHSDL